MLASRIESLHLGISCELAGSQSQSQKIELPWPLPQHILMAATSAQVTQHGEAAAPPAARGTTGATDYQNARNSLWRGGFNLT